MAPIYYRERMERKIRKGKAHGGEVQRKPGGSFLEPSGPVWKADGEVVLRFSLGAGGTGSLGLAHAKTPAGVRHIPRRWAVTVQATGDQPHEWGRVEALQQAQRHEPQATGHA